MVASETHLPCRSLQFRHCTMPSFAYNAFSPCHPHLRPVCLPACWWHGGRVCMSCGILASPSGFKKLTGLTTESWHTKCGAVIERRLRIVVTCQSRVVCFHYLQGVKFCVCLHCKRCLEHAYETRSGNTIKENSGDLRDKLRFCDCCLTRSLIPTIGARSHGKGRIGGRKMRLFGTTPDFGNCFPSDKSVSMFT